MMQKNINPVWAVVVIIVVLAIAVGLYAVLSRRAAPQATDPTAIKSQMQQMMKGQQRQFNQLLQKQNSGMMKGGQ